MSNDSSKIRTYLDKNTHEQVLAFQFTSFDVDPSVLQQCPALVTVYRKNGVPTGIVLQQRHGKEHKTELNLGEWLVKRTAWDREQQTMIHIWNVIPNSTFPHNYKLK
jgi:hypothetical protein